MRTLNLLALSALGLGTVAAQPFPQPPPAREVTVKEIPGIIAAGAQWKLVYQSSENSDGLSASEDGGILFAQEQSNHVNKLDRNDKFSTAFTAHGPGSVSAGPNNRIVVVERTCTDPGQKPDQCTEPTGIAALTPERKVLANNIGGKSLGRINDLTVSRKGDIYFTSAGVFHLNPKGEVSTIGNNIKPNGIVLSPDEKTLYVTNGPVIVAFDVQPDGTVKNQRDFVKLQTGGGDGMAIDGMGRLYVTDQVQGVEIFSPDGKHLGIIPTPRNPISAVLSGPDKKFLYISSTGALGPDGKDITVPPGKRNTAMTLYKIPVLSQGFKGRLR